MLSEAELLDLESQRKYFISNPADATYMQWLSSKGTNFDCYIEYLNGLSNQTKLNNKIDTIRTIVYALHRPFQFLFFYWTILIIILHKFNFNKPVIRIILYHFILRSLGDVIDKFGDLMPHYFANEVIKDSNDEILGYRCQYNSPSPEMHPLRWALTRQLGCGLWYLGEIVADWYPLLRTKTIAKEKKSIYLVYISCIIYNISKFSLIIAHFTLSPSELYNEYGIFNKEKVDLFYFKYWVIQLIIIYSSAFYDISVYYVLKKILSKIDHKSSSGFIKKFKSLSEYRIIISVAVNVIFLPVASIIMYFKFHYYHKYGYSELDFSFEEIRRSVNNVQYYMIFIDQILLLRTKGELITTTKHSFFPTNSSTTNNNNSISKKRNTSKRNSRSNFSSSPYKNPTLNSSSNSYHSSNIVDNFLKGDSNNNFINYNYNDNWSKNGTLSSVSSPLKNNNRNTMMTTTTITTNNSSNNNNNNYYYSYNNHNNSNNRRITIGDFNSHVRDSYYTNITDYNHNNNKIDNYYLNLNDYNTNEKDSYYIVENDHNSHNNNNKKESPYDISGIKSHSKKDSPFVDKIEYKSHTKKDYLFEDTEDYKFYSKKESQYNDSTDYKSHNRKESQYFDSSDYKSYSKKEKEDYDDYKSRNRRSSVFADSKDYKSYNKRNSQYDDSTFYKKSYINSNSKSYNTQDKKDSQYNDTSEHTYYNKRDSISPIESYYNDSSKRDSKSNSIIYNSYFYDEDNDEEFDDEDFNDDDDGYSKYSPSPIDTKPRRKSTLTTYDGYKSYRDTRGYY